MDLLYEEYPEAASIANKYGKLPSILFIESGNDWGNGDIWRKLIHAVPESISGHDTRTNLYPFMTAGACENSSLEVVYELLKLDPTLVQSGIPLEKR